VGLLVGAGALGVVATLGVVPKQVADATSSAAGRLSFVVGHERSWMDGPSSTTTLPVPTSTTVPAPAPARPPAPAPVPRSTTVPRSVPAPAPVPQQTAASGMLPPQNPSASIAPQPNFFQICSGSQYDDSSACVEATLAAIANARQDEGLPAMALPGNWTSLSPEQQLFVATNLERTARGLPAMNAMASSLDQAAEAAAAANQDPSPPPGFGFRVWGANWAGGVGNPLEAIYFWMYDDGPGSSNLDCTAADSSGCWGHRDNVLLQMSWENCVMGTGYASSTYRGTPSWAELLVEATAPASVDFTWQQQ
jgi:hypothetical protein